MKKMRALLLAVLLLVPLGGCQSSTPRAKPPANQVTEYENRNETPKRGGTLRLALTGAQSLNPILAENKNNLYILKLLFDGLFKTDASGAVEPVLCESYQISPDGLHYEFQIRGGVSFHNGARLSAEDADASLSLLLASEGVYQGRLAAVASHHSRDMTLFITLKQPVINLPALLDFPVLSKADIGTVKRAMAEASAYVPNGTGRYKVQSYKQSRELYLSVNNNYARDFSPYIENIQVYLARDRSTAVSLLENLQIDLLPSDVLRLREYTPKRSLSSAEYLSGRFTFLGVNNQRPALLSPRTRTALSACIDRVRLLSDCVVPYAEPAELPLPTRSYWYDSRLSPTAFDGAYAQALLAEDGWADGDGDGILNREVYGEPVALSLDILVNEENQTRVKLAEAIKNSFSVCGIPATVTQLPFAAYEARIQKREYDLFVGGVSLSENYDLSFLFKTDQNPFGVSSERLDQALNALPLMDGEAQKQSLFYELCGVLQDEMPLLGLYYESDVLVFDSRIRGEVQPAASDIFSGIEKWFLSE